MKKYSAKIGGVTGRYSKLVIQKTSQEVLIPKLVIVWNLINHLCLSSSRSPSLHYNAESLWSMYGILLMGEARKIQTVCWKVGQKGAVYHMISDVISSIVIILYQLLRNKNDDKGRSFPVRAPVIVRRSWLGHFEVLTAATVTVTVFRNVTLCGRSFLPKKEAKCSSQTSIIRLQSQKTLSSSFLYCLLLL